MRKILNLILFLTCIFCLSLSVHAVSGPNSLDFAERGIEAHKDGWLYSFGGKGEYQDGTRVSDCAGLLYSYFSDIGVSGCYGGCTGQVTNNCIFSSKDMSGIPNVHGLAVTMYDTVDPGSGIYGHIGIYIGGKEVCDNSTYGTNMVRAGVFERDWTEWHIFDLGMQYPVNGWYEFDGQYVHYTNYEYDTSMVIDGIEINEQGLAQSHGELSDIWTSASELKAYLDSKYGQGTVFESDASITGAGVRLRQEPSLNGRVLRNLTMGTRVKVLERVSGDVVSGVDTWFRIQLQDGLEGYVSGMYLKQDDVFVPGPVTFSVVDGSLFMECDSDYILYSNDMTEPSLDYTESINELGYTFRAVGVRDGLKGSVSEITVCSNGSVFHDFDFGAWFASAVNNMVGRGVFVGTGDNTFSPNGVLTRGQFVTALARFADADLSLYKYDSKFLDVMPNKYYTSAVNWAFDEGIISGIGNNMFGPEDSITREQLCVMLARYLNLSGDGGVSFNDDKSISYWAREAVYACKAHGVVSGIGNNIFDPRGVSTRAQAAVMLNRL